MPLYEISNDELIPFRRLRGGPQLYESQIEELIWSNPDEFLGESLFSVARQATLPGGGRADIVALDESGRVVVIEIKREVDRAQLAQCLEYAGWARSASLDDLARLYVSGPDSFFDEWRAFTDSATPTVINRSPRLVLVAHDFHGRTEQALQFLMDNRLPVTLVRVSLYEDVDGRRFVDVEGEFEPDFAPQQPEGSASDRFRYSGRRIRLADLVEEGFLLPGDKLHWDRPKLGASYTAVITEHATIELADGRIFSSPSRAAVEAAEIGSFDGWLAWRVDRLDDALLSEIRRRYIELKERKDSDDQSTAVPPE